jgi:copper oxidase (laccase) domain-containing protein
MQLPFEQFPALSTVEICRHVFTQRIPGIDVSNDKPEVLKRLDSAHREIRKAVGMGDWPLVTAQQIHGNKIAVVDKPLKTDKEFPGCDGIITNQRGRWAFTSLIAAPFTLLIQKRRLSVSCIPAAKDRARRYENR